MARVLLTGMSGAGKSTVAAALARRGHLVVETDHDGWVLPDLTWDAPRMTALLVAHPTVLVVGTVENQGAFAFDATVLLSAPLPVLLERVARRVDGTYGRTAEQRAEIAGYVETVEPLLRRAATLQLDGLRPVDELADAVEELLLGR